VIDLAVAPAAGSVRERVESLMARLPAAEACAAVEHLFGVLPLLEAFFEPAATVGVADGPRTGALGLFTPAPEPGWEAAAVDGEPAGRGLLLHGEVRVASPSAAGSLVLVRRAGPERRLAWIDHNAAGVERGSRTGGPARGDAPCWLLLKGAAVEPGLISRPVTAAPGSELSRLLTEYAGAWALAAAICAREGVRALRRAARTTGHRGTSFSASQRVALEITVLEIEVELTEAAARGALELPPGEPARAGGLALAAAAARALSAVATATAALRDQEGLEAGGPLADGGAVKILTAFLGGSPVIESELGRALGIRDLPPQEAPPL
jgi:hypothetical protein